MILNEYYGFSAVPSTAKLFNNLLHSDPAQQVVSAYNTILSLKSNNQFFIAWFGADRKEQERWSVDFTTAKPEVLLVSGSGAVFKQFALKYASAFSFTASAPVTPPVTPPPAQPKPPAATQQPAATKPPATSVEEKKSFLTPTVMVLGVLGLAGLYMWWDK